MTSPSALPTQPVSLLDRLADTAEGMRNWLESDADKNPIEILVVLLFIHVLLQIAYRYVRLKAGLVARVSRSGAAPGHQVPASADKTGCAATPRAWPSPPHSPASHDDDRPHGGGPIPEDRNSAPEPMVVEPAGLDSADPYPEVSEPSRTDATDPNSADPEPSRTDATGIAPRPDAIAAFNAMSAPLATPRAPDPTGAIRRVRPPPDAKTMSGAFTRRVAISLRIRNKQADTCGLLHFAVPVP